MASSRVCPLHPSLHSSHYALPSSVTAAKQEGISKYLDQVFDSAYNETVEKNDLPNVRWGRVDYLDVTYLTTKWNVWQYVFVPRLINISGPHIYPLRAPFLVIVTERGQTLRFYKPHQIRLRDYALRDFLLTEGWKVTSPWQSRYAPGGDRLVFLIVQLLPSTDSAPGNGFWTYLLLISLNSTTISSLSLVGCCISSAVFSAPFFSTSSIALQRTSALPSPLLNKMPHPHKTPNQRRLINLLLFKSSPSQPINPLQPPLHAQLCVAAARKVKVDNKVFITFSCVQGYL